ncbi:putative adipose-regulatory protein-domain-containing protein [Jackrogersella minutella]|nr:putative adipose-regulatory protein-domain-containing protein [Jackrogersella minutella]
MDNIWATGTLDDSISHHQHDVDGRRGSWSWSWSKSSGSGSGMSVAKTSVDLDVPEEESKATNNNGNRNQNTIITCLDSPDAASFWPLVSPACNFTAAASAATTTSITTSTKDIGPGELRGLAPNGAFGSPVKMEYAKSSYRAATSPTAKRTYVNAALLCAASLALLCIAALAYPVFYYNYVPKKVISIPVHLQYDSGLNPYGVTSLSSNLMLEQAYDVSVELTVPRSPPNLQRGNFMVALVAMKSVPGNPAFAFSFAGATEDPYTHVREDNVVFMSRRPTLIPYADPLVSTASRFLFLFYHILYPGAGETTTLTVPMGELVEFKNVLPLSMLLDVQAGQTLQVYSATVTLVARLTGIRWAMYNHRIISFVVCTTVFWIAEMLSAALAWLLLNYFISSQKPEAPEKNRDVGFGNDPWMGPPPNPVASFRDEDGDSEGEIGTGVKKEESDEDDEDVKIKDESPERETLLDHPADDEEDGDDVWRESGAGTSFSHEKGGSLRRRPSRGRA